jgi:diacylglycerol kinase (ATP)
VKKIQQQVLGEIWKDAGDPCPTNHGPHPTQTPFVVRLAHTLAIINPVAGRGAAARTWARVLDRVDAAGRWEYAFSQGPGHARELAAAAAGRYNRVIAVGGDGTASEVANGLAHSATALALIPAGRGNDLARNLKIPHEALAATHLALHGAERAIDLGEITTPTTSRYFINIAGFGFDAEVAWRVNRLPELGGGTLPYLAGVLQTLFQYRAPGMRLRLDRHAIDRRVFLVAVGNCASYGGGMHIVPDARPDDGLLDVCVVKDLSRLEVLRLLPRLYKGKHVGHPAVEVVRCESVSADASVRVLLQADGELVGALPARFGLRRGALRCVTGPPSSSPS